MLRVRHTARPGESKAFQRIFAPDRVTLGVFFPIEAFRGDEPMRIIAQQSVAASRWREAVAAAASGVFKPFAQSLYIDLTGDPNHLLHPIHLGFRGGWKAILGFLAALHGVGVHHVILNLKYGTREAGEVLEEIGREILPRVREFRAADTLHHA
jgi:hypothetical protein